MPLLHPAPTTRHCEAEGLVITLDLRNGRYTTLHRAASAMWHGLLESDERAALEADLAARLGAPAERVAADLEAFVRASADRERARHASDASAGPRRPPGRPRRLRGARGDSLSQGEHSDGRITRISVYHGSGTSTRATRENGQC